jgi:hypothetical protein
MTGPPNVTVQATVPQPNMGLGGAGSQIRALQHLPPNTRLVRGPNGQVTLQKIQTIELSQEKQQTFRVVAARIADIERQAVKTPQDEAELARLYTKQQQILSTGRAVPAQQPQAVAHTVPQPNVSPGMKGLTTIPSNVAKPSGPIRYTHTVGNKEISVPTGPGGPPIPTVLPAPVLQQAPTRPPNANSSIPPLTDHQKRIVAEFKSKIATLPPDQQQAYIAQNKLNLIKQLNFQPSQLQVLQGTRPAVPQRPQVPAQLPALAGDRSHIVTPGLHPLKPMPAIQQINPPTLVPQGLALPINPLPTEAAESHRTAMCPPINKSKKIAWVESQIKKDQQEAVNPNYKTPFRSKEDACKRLLRYHVFDDPDIDPGEFSQLDEDFEVRSEFLLTKYQAMLSRYHFLLLQESTRQVSSSEEVMLGRQWVAAEKQDLAKEKEERSKISARLDELKARESPTEEEQEEEKELSQKLAPDFPLVPNSWSEKFEQVMGRPMKEDATTDKDDTSHIETKQKEIKEEDDSLKDEPLSRSRSESGNKMKEVRVSLTNVMKQHGVKRELEDDGSLISGSSRAGSAEPGSPEDSHVIGLKFNRTMSGRWSASLKRDASDGEEEYDEFNAIQNHLSGFRDSRGVGNELYSESPMFEQRSKIRKPNDSDDDEDFSLADVGSSAAVRSMLGHDLEDDDLNEDMDLRFQSPSAVSLDHFGSATPSRFGVDCATPNLDSEPTDNDSVQNAINSILDLPDRGGVQTPDDLNNLTGLLDSMESDEQADPSLDAAVASIL